MCFHTQHTLRCKQCPSPLPVCRTLSLSVCCVRGRLHPVGIYSVRLLHFLFIHTHDDLTPLTFDLQPQNQALGSNLLLSLMIQALASGSTAANIWPCNSGGKPCTDTAMVSAVSVNMTSSLVTPSGRRTLTVMSSDVCCQK